MAEQEKIATTDSAGCAAPERTQNDAGIFSRTSGARHTSSLGPGANALFRKIFSFNTVLVFLLLGAVIGTVYLNIRSTAQAGASDAGHAIFEGDTWWHLEVGNHILSTHSWPTHDSYSFTAHGDNWIAYEWLGDVLIAATSRLSGLAGMTLLLLILGAALVLLMYDYARLRSNNSKAAFAACALLLPLTVISLTLRPQLLGYVFLVTTLIWLEKFRQGKQKNLWLLPALFLVWVNVHGSFAFGLAALGLYWVSGLTGFRFGQIRCERWNEKQRRHLAVVMLLSLIALMVTPYGTQLASNPVNMAFLQPVNIGSFQEWRIANFGASYGKLLLALIFLFLLLPLFMKIEYRLEEIILVLFGIYAACVHMRFVIIFAILFAPFLATVLARFAPAYDASKDKPFLNLALVVLIAFGCIRLFPSRATLQKVVSHGFPTAAVEYLRQHPSAGPVFNNEFWGGYLIYKLQPEQKVFIDGRADLYESAGVLSDYLRIMTLSGNTRFLLRKYKVRSCLVQPHSQLATFLAQLPGWQRVYSDGISVIFSRRTTAPAKLDQEKADGQRT